MSRAILPVAFVLCVLLMVGCGGDSGTNPKPEPVRGFTVEYGNGTNLGTGNMCRKRLDGTCCDDVFLYDVWCDWWADDSTSAEIDSIWFGIAMRVAAFESDTYMRDCYQDTVMYRLLYGEQDDNHWKYHGRVGEWGYSNEYEWYYCWYVKTYREVGEEAHPPKARVFWKDGTDSLYKTDLNKR